MRELSLNTTFLSRPFGPLSGGCELREERMHGHLAPSNQSLYCCLIFRMGQSYPLEVPDYS